MEALLLGAILGFGTLLIFDAIVRPEARPSPLRLAARLGPKGAAAFAGAAIAFGLTGWTAAGAAGAVVGWITPIAVKRVRGERDRLARTEAIAELAGRIRDSLRSGIGIQDALKQAARNAPNVLASDFNRLVADVRVSGLSIAAERFALRIDDQAGDLFASALGLAERVGSGYTSELLDSLADSAHARAAVMREAKARQAHNRTSARIVAAAPVLLLIAIKRANPAFLEPFDTLLGQTVLTVAFAMIAAGYLAMTRMGRLEGGTR